MPSLSANHLLSLIVFVAILAAPFRSAHAVNTYVEDFTTTAFKDGANTTADWDTAAGELKLPLFVYTLAGSVDTPDAARDVAVAGDHAFVADRSSGLQVIDITDPTNPTLAGSYDTPGSAHAVAVAGDHAFVADGASGLQVIDITDPINPILTGSG